MRSKYEPEGDTDPKKRKQRRQEVRNAWKQFHPRYMEIGKYGRELKDENTREKTLQSLKAKRDMKKESINKSQARK